MKTKIKQALFTLAVLVAGAGGGQVAFGPCVVARHISGCNDCKVITYQSVLAVDKQARAQTAQVKSSSR